MPSLICRAAPPLENDCIVQLPDILLRQVTGSFRQSCRRILEELHYLRQSNKERGTSYYFAIYLKGFHDNRWECVLNVSKSFFSIYYSGGKQCEFDVCSRFARRSNLFEKRYGAVRIFLDNEDITKTLYNNAH